MNYQHFTRTLSLAATIAGGTACLAESPPPAKPSPAPASAPAFNPPFPERTNPFQLPDSKAALASRREAVVQQIDLRLKGFVNVGGTLRAVVAIDGDIAALGVGDRRGDIQILEVAPPMLTLQRGRHRWTESLLDVNAAASEAKAK